jgi:cytochrome c553
VRGKELTATCVACHGADGNTQTPIYPKLAGQYETYLLHVLREYKSGVRQNAIMQGMVAALSDQDLKDLAAFYAEQDGLFNTVIKY